VIAGHSSKFSRPKKPRRTPVESDDSVVRVIASDDFSAVTLPLIEVTGSTLTQRNFWSGNASVFINDVGRQLGTSVFVIIDENDFTYALMRGAGEDP